MELRTKIFLAIAVLVVFFFKWVAFAAIFDTSLPFSNSNLILLGGVDLSPLYFFLHRKKFIDLCDDKKSFYASNLRLNHENQRFTCSFELCKPVNEGLAARLLLGICSSTRNPPSEPVTTIKLILKSPTFGFNEGKVTEHANANALKVYKSGLNFVFLNYLQQYKSLKDLVYNEGYLDAYFENRSNIDGFCLEVLEKAREQLGNVWDKGYLHGDISASNIMYSLSPKLDVVVIDYGDALKYSQFSVSNFLQVAPHVPKLPHYICSSSQEGLISHARKQGFNCQNESLRKQVEGICKTASDLYPVVINTLRLFKSIITREQVAMFAQEYGQDMLVSTYFKVLDMIKELQTKYPTSTFLSKIETYINHEKFDHRLYECKV